MIPSKYPRDTLPLRRVETAKHGLAHRFIGKLKQEQWDGRRYRNLAEVCSDLGRMLDQVYNQQRLPSALVCRSPAEFERINSATSTPLATTTLSLVSPPQIRCTGQSSPQPTATAPPEPAAKAPGPSANPRPDSRPPLLLH